MVPTDFPRERQKMIERQLRRRKISDERVLAAIGHVPRERFVCEELVPQAYADRALPIDCEQTISQPYIVALMTEALDLSGDESVLEIGTGSGYQTAILCELAREVTSIERHAGLARTAAQQLQTLGYPNVRVYEGDGTLGCPQHAPYDRILVTAGGPHIPPALFEQLAEGGILVMPVGGTDSQSLRKVIKVNGQAHMTDLGGCRFVRLIGEEGWGVESPPSE